MSDRILAGRTALLEAVFTTEATPSPAPAAQVCVTDANGVLLTTIAGTVAVNGTTVTVTAEWPIPDATPRGEYPATFTLTGSVYDAIEHVVRVVGRHHPHPHPPP